mmetsp:Transcript_7380/g.5646  ORF Transcript_7380/g.5646 Transcript_7380/m.5646 type:complete len:100 (+) Transcript_7380:145-444(+)
MPRGSATHHRIHSAQVMPLEKRGEKKESGSYIVPLKGRTASAAMDMMRLEVPFNRLAFDRWLAQEKDQVPPKDVESLWKHGSQLKVPDMAQTIYREMLA